MKETALKYGCLFDFFATNLLTMHAYTHAHPCSLFKTEEKRLVDRSLCIEKMLIVCSSQIKCSKVGFLDLVLFYGRLNCFVLLCGFITFLWLTMWLTVVG